MASVNKVILVGNLGADPESRTMTNGGVVVNLRVATSETWTKDGERKEKTEWHNVVIWNEHLSKVATQYLKKGAKVYLEGTLQTRKWTDQSGADKYTTEVVLPRFGGALVMLDGREEAKPEPKGYTPRQKSAQNSPEAWPKDPYEDVPF